MKEASSGHVVVLLRHGHVVGIDPPRFRGREELPLSELGHAQAKATAAFLKDRHDFGTVLSSPLERCLRTAATVCPGCRASPIDDLTDLDYGAWQGRSHEQVRSEQPAAYDAWLATPAASPPPGGETLQHAAERATRVLRSLPSRMDGSSTLVVTHNSTLRLLSLLALGLPIERYWHVRHDPCGLSILERAGEGWTLHSLNETAHLAAVRETVGDRADRS